MPAGASSPAARPRPDPVPPKRITSSGAGPRAAGRERISAVAQQAVRHPDAGRRPASARRGKGSAMTFQNPAHRGGPRRGRFDQLAEYASNFTSSPLFFLFCLLLVGFFVAAHIALLPSEVLLLAGGSMTAVTLLLLALLKNAEMRAEHAIQRKLDAIAAALLEAHRDDRGQAFEDLRKAIRMEEET